MSVCALSNSLKVVPFVKCIPSLYITQRRLVDIPKTSDEVVSKSAEKAQGFCRAVCQDDMVIRTFKQLKKDFDHMSPTGRGFFAVASGVTALYTTQVVGAVPLSLLTGSYLSYKYVKHTGQLDKWMCKAKG